MIRPSDRVSSVLAKDERLLEVFVRASPTFEKLRSPALRSTMARLVTVEQAARVAGIDAAALVDRLNRAVDGESLAEPSLAPMHTDPGALAPSLPAALAAVPPERIVDVDVREDLRAGREPFHRIFDAARTLPEGAVLRIRAIFEPAPLYAVLGKRGLEHFTERLAADDWRVWFHPGEVATVAREPADADTAADHDVVVIDVRDLEPPEPMVRTLEALATLPRGKVLVQINARVPQFLLPKLAERGFTYEIREQSRDVVRLFIRHKEL